MECVMGRMAHVTVVCVGYFDTVQLSTLLLGDDEGCGSRKATGYFVWGLPRLGRLSGLAEAM